MPRSSITPIPMVDLKEEWQLIRSPILKNMTKVLDSGKYILGEFTEKFEKAAASYVEATYGIGTANGTDALQLALQALNIGPGDEVITTPFTFFATGEVIAQAGAKPVFADIKADTYNIDPAKIEEAITEKTKAIIVVHLYGQAASMNDIMKIAKHHHISVIEDACQAIGTEYNGKRVGAIGDIGCFSFFPSKNLGAFGDAGLVVTNEKKLYESIKRLRNHGSNGKYSHSSIGMNSRLDELQAAILLAKLDYLDSFLEKRRNIARRYTENLNPLLFNTPLLVKDRQHTFHQYCIELENRDELVKALKSHGIDSAVYYPIPLHLQQAFRYLQHREGDFPVAERVATRILALPIYPLLSEQNQDYIISVIEQTLNKKTD